MTNNCNKVSTIISYAYAPFEIESKTVKKYRIFLKNSDIVFTKVQNKKTIENVKKNKKKCIQLVDVRAICIVKKEVS